MISMEPWLNPPITKRRKKKKRRGWRKKKRKPAPLTPFLASSLVQI